MKLKITVPPLGTETRLDKFLSSVSEVGSRSKAAQLIDAKSVLINGKPAKASQIVRTDDLIEVALPEIENTSSLQPLDISLDIIHEDNDVIVINKPAGLVVHPAAGHANDTLVNALIHHSKDLAMGFGELRPGIVHRLDRDTSGLLVIAKNDIAHRSLAKQFKEKTAHRVYWAVAYGVPKKLSGRIESTLARHPNDRKRFASTKKEGRIAITNYHVLRVDSSRQLSLIELKLETGRTHQIRVHLSELGHPIVGDIIYGAKSRTKNIKSLELRTLISSMPRFALHAAELGFTHPTTNKAMMFTSPWPQSLVPLLEKASFI